MKPLLITVVFIAILSCSLQAQDTSQLVTLRTDANLKSGNNRDVLTSFFQIALNDLTGNDKRLRFSSNLFAIRLKSNPSLNIDTNYIHQKFWRNSNIDFDLRMRENFEFNGASIGYRYAIVNKRDYSSSSDFLKDLSLSFGPVAEITSKATQVIIKLVGDDFNKITELQTELNQFLNDSSMLFSACSPAMQSILQTSLGVHLTDDFNYKKFTTARTNETIKRYNDKFLWTIDAHAATHDDGTLFSMIQIDSRATAGIARLKHRHSLEYDIRAGVHWVDDSLIHGSQRMRTTALAEAGLNLVLRDKQTQKSYLECKVSAFVYQLFPGAVTSGYQKLFLNTTINVRITDNIWIPLMIKYDPEHANLFGYFSIKSNFDWLGSFLK
jgi:hypothetical protein